MEKNRLGTPLPPLKLAKYTPVWCCVACGDLVGGEQPHNSICDDCRAAEEWARHQKGPDEDRS